MCRFYWLLTLYDLINFGVSVWLIFASMSDTFACLCYKILPADPPNSSYCQLHPGNHIFVYKTMSTLELQSPKTGWGFANHFYMHGHTNTHGSPNSARTLILTVIYILSSHTSTTREAKGCAPSNPTKGRNPHAHIFVFRSTPIFCTHGQQY